MPDRLATLLPLAKCQVSEPKYRHWETLRRVRPPEGVSSTEWWAAVKFGRSLLYKRLPLVDRDGHPFVYAMPDVAHRLVHRVDQYVAGRIGVSEPITNSATRDRYLVSSLMEEAITSSQLEGASTTRVVAKEMIRSGRAPRDVSERMILNNFRGMEHIRAAASEPLTPELVCHLQRILTEGTLDNPDAAGRLQPPGASRVRVYDTENNVLHDPPPAEELPERLESMCEFANAEDDEEGFLHPVVRSVLLHFWLAYDHPFEDGNGRTARALFYWSMLRRGYWLTEFLSISTILRKAPAQYGKSFLYVETDEGDTTYFILYQLGVVARAIEEFHAYLDRKTQEVRAVEAVIRRSRDFNHRQLALLGHALRNPGAYYTFQSHARSHNVVYQSARTDLLGLVARGLLERRQIGRAFHFFPVKDLAARLAAA